MEVRSHGNNVCDVIIAHVMSGDAQIYIDTNRCGKHKVIFGPAGHAQSTAGWKNNICRVPLDESKPLSV